MPANLHTKKANTKRRKKMWVRVRESAIKSGKDTGTADRIANGVVKKDYVKYRTRKKTRKRNPKRKVKRERTPNG